MNLITVASFESAGFKIIGATTVLSRVVSPSDSEEEWALACSAERTFVDLRKRAKNEKEKIF